MRTTGLVLLIAALLAGCARAPARPAPVPPPSGNAYVAPQSAPVLPPSYPPLVGDPVQPATASIPLVQGR